MNTISLAVTTRILPDGTEDACLAMRVIPTSIVDGAVVSQDAIASTYYLGSMGEVTDEAKAAKVSALLAAIKALVE